MSAEFLGGFRRKIKKLVEEPEVEEDLYRALPSKEWLQENPEHPEDDECRYKPQITPIDIGKQALRSQATRNIWG